MMADEAEFGGDDARIRGIMTPRTTFSSIVKMEPAEGEEEEIEGEGNTFWDSRHFLDYSILPDVEESNIFIKDEEEDYSNCWTGEGALVGNYIKSEPISSEDEDNTSFEIGVNVEMDNDNSKDLDWNVEQELAKLKTSRKTVAGNKRVNALKLKLRESKKKYTGAVARSEPKDLGLVQSAFKGIAATLGLSKGRTKQRYSRGTKNTIATAKMKKEDLTGVYNKMNKTEISMSSSPIFCQPSTSAASDIKVLSRCRSPIKSMPLISPAAGTSPPVGNNPLTLSSSRDQITKTNKMSDESPGITSPITSKTKIRCMFCDQICSRFKSHYKTYFHPFQCITCLSTFPTRIRGMKHIQTDDLGERCHSLISGNFLISPPLAIPKLDKCSWFKCTECESLLKTEYLLIIHYQRAHEHIYNDFTEEEYNSASMSSFEINGRHSSWSTKMKFRNCEISLTRIDETKSCKKLMESYISTQFLNVFDKGCSSASNGRVINKKGINCDLCPKAFATKQGHMNHMRRDHAVTMSSLVLLVPPDKSNHPDAPPTPTPESLRLMINNLLRKKTN